MTTASAVAPDGSPSKVTSVRISGLPSPTHIGAPTPGMNAASNLLVADGRLRAVLDFGCAAVGDPACYGVMAWTFFTGESSDVFRTGLPFDGATWARGRGWALWKALITLADEKRGRAPGNATARRVGWRIGASDIIHLVLADHRRAA